ncbi:MAG: tetratricopeptide repeat protein [Candidatus Omnitrophica bacterium]|nr:tetratricopeptide repeat protein [Candidatus Omnitrophota bacterium]
MKNYFNALVIVNTASLFIFVIVLAVLFKNCQTTIRLGQNVLKKDEPRTMIKQKQDSVISKEQGIFSKAMMLKNSARYKEAIAAFKEAAEEYPQSVLADNAYYQIAQILIADPVKKPREAAAVYHFIVEAYPKSEIADDAQYQLAKIAGLYFKEPLLALDEYRKLIALFPQSKYVKEAQSAIDFLTSDPNGDGIPLAESMGIGIPDEAF